VSHDMNMVKELCERGIVIAKGKKVFDGPILEAVEFMTGR
jgi:ABC-2 type transport system ATP-binding protein